MTGDTWTAPSGKVHLRRQRFYLHLGPAHITPADPAVVTMLCGTRVQLAPDPGRDVDCGICTKSAKHGGQHP